MKLTEEEIAGDIIRISLDGRLDIDGTQAIDPQFSYLTTTRPGRFAVDLSRVSFIASIGIRMLLTAARAQANRGGKLVLVGPDPMGRKVLETAGVDQLVPIAPDLDGARGLLAAT
jgi:anti-anti-sigma factor